MDVLCGCVPGVLVAGGRALARARSEVEPAASGRCGSVEAVEAVARVQGVLLGKHLRRTRVRNSCHLSTWALFVTVTPKLPVTLGWRECGPRDQLRRRSRGGPGCAGDTRGERLEAPPSRGAGSGGCGAGTAAPRCRRPRRRESSRLFRPR